MVAEEYAFADNLCGGRLNFAIGSGFSPVEYKTFGMSLEEARERYWETFDVILKAWTQDEFCHKGRFYQIEDGSLYVKPMQKPLPPTWVAASSNESLSKAGELGCSIMGIPFVRSNTILDVKEKNDLFKEAYRSAGHATEPDIIVALHFYLHPNQDEAVKLARPYFERTLLFHKTYRRPGSKIPDFDNLIKERLVVFSSPRRAQETLREYEALGATHVICMVNFGGVPMPEVRRTMELISQELMPKLA
jgi:alkanesulfonate monooxygenase SsuD/methylene tetrahydromethanopterin reductase-like flavin-dependent oxidoreductase (luciferase family)